MFDPEWEDGCPSCSAGAEEISPGHLDHLHKRDTTFAYVSRAPFAKIEDYRRRRGWQVPWYSSYGSDFNYDFHVTLDETVAPAEYNYRSQEEFRRLGARVRAGRASFRDAAASCVTATASTTPTRSTPAAWRRSAARTTCSTRPRSVVRRIGRSPRGARRRLGGPRRLRGLRRPRDRLHHPARLIKYSTSCSRRSRSKAGRWEQPGSRSPGWLSAAATSAGSARRSTWSARA